MAFKGRMWRRRKKLQGSSDIKETTLFLFYKKLIKMQSGLNNEFEFFVRLQVKTALYEYRRFQRLLPLFADTNLIDMEYNCIEVYQKEGDGVWRVIHSTWSFIRSMEKRFKEEKDIV